MSNIHETLKDVFGYSQFRKNQESVINDLLAGNDSLVIMPTGGGKSICYQLPAIVSNGIALIVSPLIALMNDQVSSLQQLGVKAYALHSNIPREEKNSIHKSIQDGTLKLLYVSPEKIVSDGFVNYLQNLDISLIAIDEAHCVSVWGNDFRPDYVALKVLKTTFPKAPLIALTATADAATQSDIKKQLGIASAETYISSFERENISVEARPGQKRIQQIINWVTQRKGKAGIVYCLSRKNTETVSKKLRDLGYNSAYYHAGMEGIERQLVQKRFSEDDIDIVCATIAFGMGIDKPNIRWVIHYSMPKNLEAYYQEIGRAGRDGDPAEALLFFSWGDFLNLQKFIEESPSADSFKEVQRAKLDRMWTYANSSNCRTNIVLNYFGEYKNEACDHCDNCLHPPKYIDGTQYAQMAISAIIRTHETLNITLLVDLLRGSARQEVISKGLDKVKTFGAGRMVPYVHWMQYITQMINQGIIQLDFSDRSRLKLTPLSMAILKEGKKVQLSEYEKVGDKAKKKVAVTNVEYDLSDMDKLVYKRLRLWRTELAKSKSVPSFVIMHDKTLKQIAAAKPKDLAELLTVDGIGQKKSQDYGKDILDIINN